jgi:YesN/AraC family two-component response regulator
VSEFYQVQKGPNMVIYLKNMVCNRCKMVVRSIFEEVGLNPIRVELGEVEIRENNTGSVGENLIQRLQVVGFEVLDDRKSQTIEKIKTLITDLVQHRNNDLDTTLSEYLTRELYQDYSALSALFSEVEGITIEKYVILQKIEKVKELLVYDEKTLTEIAFQLHYSSVAYLSNQFKKVTGLSPSHFKKQRTIHRKPLDEL